jgi:membrane protein
MRTDSAPPAVVRSDVPVDDPTDLTRADYKVVLLRTKAAVKRDDVPSLAAGVAFKIFLALFPALLAAVAIFSLVTDPAQLEEYLALLEGVVPEQALGILRTALENIVATDATAAGGLAVTGVLAGLFSASSAAATLVKALNRAYEVGERGFVKQRLVSLAITFALLVTILALIVLVVAGPQVQRLLVPAQLEGTAASVGFTVAQIVVVLLLVVALFAFIYWIGPNREHRSWVWLSPGAVVGVAGWLLLSLGFTLYVQNFGEYEATYGALGGVIVLLLWLQLSMAILLIGAELNAEIERLNDQRDAIASAVGMGHLAEPLDSGDSGPATALLTPGVPSVGGQDSAEPERAEPDSAGHHAPAPPVDGAAAGRAAGGSTAIVAGAAATAATLAAVIGGLRRRS